MLWFEFLINFDRYKCQNPGKICQNFKNGFDPFSDFQVKIGKYFALGFEVGYYPYICIYRGGISGRESGREVPHGMILHQF